MSGGLLLSASVLWWATRAGGLLAAMMASVPAWRSFDPLPILARARSADRPGEPADNGEAGDESAGARAFAAKTQAGAKGARALMPRQRPMLEEMAGHP